MNNTDIEEYCDNPFLKKDYYEVFKDKSIIGMHLGVAAVVTSPFNPYDNVVDYPFLNRAVGIGASNVVELSYWQTMPTNYSDFHTSNALVANPISRGVARANKFVVNVWLQNILIGIFIDPISNEGYTLVFAKQCLLSVVARSGSEVIGAIEKKIIEPIDKVIYTGSVFASIAAVSSLFSPDISYKINGATYFSSQDIVKVSGGLIASYFILDASLYASENIPVYQEVMNSVSDISRSFALAAISCAIVANKFSLGKNQKAVSDVKTMIVFSIAKGVGVTFIEVVDDYMGLSEFVSESVNSGLELINNIPELISDFINPYGLISIGDYIE